MLENGLTLSPYNFITILIATGVCALVAFLYYRFCYDSFKKLLHRQKLARMVLENKWYEADTVQDSGFFTDLQSRSREKIVWFPKIYYQMEKGLLHIRCEITLGKYQDQLLRLEDKLESGLYCELTDKTLHDGYIEYTLLYDMIANRITIDEVRAENGCLRLMKNLVWEYDALPHALIAGGTGGGKTYFLLTLIEALLHTNAVLYILDPKNSDLADLGTVMPNVYHTKEEMIDCVKSYTGIWNVEKVLYAINDFNLPFPVTFTQITWFVITEFIIILFGDIPPLSMIEGAFLKYFGIPVALTWFMSQKTFDGKKPYSFLKSQITYALRPKITYAGKAVKLHKQTLNETITAVRSVNYVPDKIY